MHEIDHKTLVQVLRNVIKSIVGDTAEWEYVQKCLRERTTTQVLAARNWDCLDKLQCHRSDYTIMENIVFHAIQQYLQVKKLENLSFQFNEKDRGFLRDEIVMLLPEAFSNNALKVEWLEEKKAKQKLELPVELQCVLRFAQEKTNQLLKMTLTMEEGGEIQQEFELRLKTLKKKLDQIAVIDKSAINQNVINKVRTIRSELEVIETNFPAVKNLHFTMVQNDILFVKKIKAETDSLLKKIADCLGKDKSSLMADQKISDSYLHLLSDYQAMEIAFLAARDNIPLQSLRSSNEALQSVMRLLCDLQKRIDLLQLDIDRRENPVVEEKTAINRVKVQRGGFFKKRFSLIANQNPASIDDGVQTDLKPGRIT